MQPIFRLKNLECSYLPNQPVLKVNDLTLHKGQLVFILGASGIGKSTLIETLGLMNRTIVAKPTTSVQFIPEEKPLELKDFWETSQADLATFREKYFSFIFQNTNLMPNFSAGENMCISQLIQGKTMEAAKVLVLQQMKDLRLEPEVFDKKITDLSGGQRQRLAFVRAITADFSVLFGDEPTGNLDQSTAFQLMKVLKKKLKKHQRTGVIVSHNIELAHEFADHIVLIEKEKNGQYGIIAKENELHRDGEFFKTFDNQIIVDAKDFITKFLSLIHI